MTRNAHPGFRGGNYVNVGIGLAGSVFFAFPHRSTHVLGAVLFWLHSVLDGCDGELARLKFAESRWGGLLDFWGDNVVHSAVFVSIALGICRAQPGTTPFVLATLAVSGTLLSAGLVYWTTLRRKMSGGPLFTSVVGTSSPDGELPGPAERIADQLARRDFIYLVVALAIFGYVKGRFTGASPVRSSVQTTLIGGVAAGAAYSIAKLFS